MKTDEKEVAYIIELSKHFSKNDVDEFDYFHHILAKLKFEMKIKKEKLIELSQQDVSINYPANLTDVTTGFLNYVNNNSDGFTTINENDIILANKGVAAFENLENIIEAIYLMCYRGEEEHLKKLIKNICEDDGGCLNECSRN